MAIDSEVKRRSVHGYTLNVILPTADGAIGAADRAHAAWFFRGFTYDLPTPADPFGPQFHRLFNLHHNIPGFS